MNKTIGVLALAIIVIATGALLYTNQVNKNTASEHMVMFGEDYTVTMYKDPNCGCCTGYAEALRREGFEVIIEETRDLASVKQTHNIPPERESCHTSIIGDYIVEGHVPLEAVNKLLTERPDIAGIGLPSMPIGTPGMPGLKTAPYEVYQLSATGDISPYVTI